MRDDEKAEVVEEAIAEITALRSVLGDLCDAAEKVNAPVHSTGDGSLICAECRGTGAVEVHLPGCLFAALAEAVVKARQVRGEE